MQTPSECLPSQINRASSELSLRGSDAIFSLSQLPFSLLLRVAARDAHALPLLSSPLSLSLVSYACMCPLPLPHFLLPHRRHAFLCHCKKKIIKRGVSNGNTQGNIVESTTTAILPPPFFFFFFFFSCLSSCASACV